MQQPQNQQTKNSLPSNQGSDLQVQRLRAKLTFVYRTPLHSNNHTKSEPHFKQTQSKQIDTARNQSDNTAILNMKQSLFNCSRQKVCKGNYCKCTLHIITFSVAPQEIMFPSTPPLMKSQNMVLYQGVVLCPLHP